MLQSKFSHIGIFFPLQHFQASLMLVLLAPYVFSHPKSLFVPATGLWSLPHRFPVGLFPAQGSVFQVNIILFPAKILCAGSFLTVFNWEQLPKSCLGAQLLFFGPVIPAFFGSFLPACESKEVSSYSWDPPPNEVFVVLMCRFLRHNSDQSIQWIKVKR